MTGARAGKVAHFDKPRITLGRQKDVDVQFDPRVDIDVSGRHAEIRLENGRYVVQDMGSTNGTFVNGEKVEGTRELQSGDRVQLGSKGPDVEVRVHRGSARNTEERIAIAVKKQTAGLRNAVIGAAALVVLGLGATYVVMQRSGERRVEELNRILQRTDSIASNVADPELVEALHKKTAALRQAMAAATTDAERDSLRREIQANDARLRRMVQMDLAAIHRRNAPAVAVLVAEIKGIAFAGTGFSISSDGLLMTNRHNVLTDDDTASRVAVKFVDTREWIPARVVRISDDPDDDLALIQLEGTGPWPAVAGISSGADAVEGTAVATIGFPLGYDTPQEGEGNDFLAKSTLNAGTVSKRTSTVLQIDSYAAHGSSGSPVFNSLGRVVGVIFGGQPEAGGRIVFAVPPERVARFVPAETREIVKE